ncbi:MAG: PEP-CTERM sorting domain-containing protein [Tepidisphaeraceae bacterium]
MLRSWRFGCLAFLVAAMILGGTARGAVIAQYSFTGNTLSATTVAPNATAGSVTGSPNVNNQPTSALTFATGVGYATQPTLAAARANTNESGTRSDVYFTFTVSADAGNELDLSSLTFNVAQGGGTAGTRDYEIRSSLDGFATSLTGIVPIPTVRPTFTPVTLDLSGAQFQNLTSPLTLQVRYFTPGVLQNVDFDDIVLNGTVAVVPEPNALAVLVTAGGWMLRRRRREV